MVRNPKRTEAGIQADVRQFILSAPFELEPGDLNDVSLESPVGDRRRIDVEAGSTVIEVKRDLRKEKSKRDAEKQLAGYVEFRMQQTGLRYVGVLTTVRNRFVEAGRLDALEAPQRAIDVRKRQEAEDRLVFDKARSANLLFKSTLRRFLEEQCPPARVRAIMEGESGHDGALWDGLAALGVPGLVVPEAQGGAGVELLDLALAAEELGYAGTPGPFAGNAIATIALLESDAGRYADRLRRIASGEAIVTAALGEDEARWAPRDLATRVSDGRLTGAKPFVPYAREAAAMVVAAVGDDGPGLWLVERNAAGIQIDERRLVDATRRVQAVTFRETPAEPLSNGARALRRALDAGAVLIAADAYGGSRRCLDMTVAYVMQREQFGQAIGAFQAVKHQLANLACELEPALSLWWYAAHAFDRIPEQAERHAALAKALLCDLYDRVTRECTELHGGIGFTWEYDLHLWFRRAIFDRGFLGESAFHRARAADLAGW